MEQALGVTEDSRHRYTVTSGQAELGENATAADYQDEIQGNDAARHRYQRMFWEPVVEGQVSVVLYSTITPGRLTYEL